MRRRCFVDIFSGAGGSSLGFLEAEFKPLAALDFYNYANRTYERNIGIKPTCADARFFNFEKWATKLGDVDVLIGCPPCQGFSRMNMRRMSRKHTDPRNELVITYIRAVKAIGPDVAVFENVRGIIKYQGGVYFRLLIEEFKKMDYKVAYGILDAVNYGVPQRRKRLIIIASKIFKPKLPEPTHLSPSSPEVIRGLKKPWKTVGDTIKDLPPLGFGERHPTIPNHETRNLPDNWVDLIKAIPKNGGSRKDAPRSLWLPCHLKHNGHYDVFGRLRWDKPANTITTGCWNPSKGRFVHPEQDRGLSLRECARLQSFPDNFIFLGPPSSIAKQIGNAFPPLLAKAIAFSIKQMI
mgnify:CR=1 FL=1